MKHAARWLLCLSFPLAASAQQPRVVNAKVQTVATANLDADFHRIAAAQSAPAWIGYAVPGIAATRGGDWCGGLALEGHRAEPAASSSAASELVVLYRVAANAVDRIRTARLDCELDAGGLPFLWLTGVRPADSVRLLASMTARRGESPLNAIAQHNDPAADQALENFAAASQPEKTRERALFWLGASRGRRGFEVVRRALAQEPDDRVREKAVFAISVSKEPDAAAALVNAAKNDKSARVRGQALFWLAHKAGAKETAAITDAIRNDPDTQVKRKAVFALRELPNGQGVPLLIEVARNNKNPEVRKQAMFWLGQSKDPRAAAFFEEVLK